MSVCSRYRRDLTPKCIGIDVRAPTQVESGESAAFVCSVESRIQIYAWLDVDVGVYRPLMLCCRACLELRGAVLHVCAELPGDQGLRGISPLKRLVLRGSVPLPIKCSNAGDLRGISPLQRHLYSHTKSVQCVLLLKASVATEDVRECGWLSLLRLGLSVVSVNWVYSFDYEYFKL